MKIKIRRSAGVLLIISSFASVIAVAGPTKAPTLSLKDFIQQATQNDSTFEKILIDQFVLQYRRTILLPESDVFMNAKYQHNFYLDQNRSNPEATISLNKLFPYNGTEVSLSYNKDSSASSSIDNSNLTFLISQPIAKNAFGSGTRLLDKIIGVENDISRYQIIEAYEDYLASLTTAYYNWYSAYENLKVGQSSLNSSKKLLANIIDRQKQKIALPIDVNKMKLLLIGKKENLIVLNEIYDTLSNLIFKAIKYKSVNPYIPEKPGRPVDSIKFQASYDEFTLNSRTYKTLRLLEQQGGLQVEKATDELLPSTNLLLGYQLDGDDWGISNQEDSYFAGISLSWPIGRNSDRAKQQISRIEHKKTLLSNRNKYDELQTNLKNIFLQIQREESLIKISKKKIQLAESILDDESENYSFGKVTLNDYLDAVNRVDENRFSHTEHIVNLNKLLVEWLRLTDKLVNKDILKTKPSL